jgi:hypothetical protein
MMLPTDNNNNKPSILKSTREAKGMTIEIVHEATKIPMDVLRAIEEGYSVRILSPFYYRGFIKIYAEFLDLDVKAIYKQYGLDQLSPKPASLATVSVKTGRMATPQQPNVLLEQIQEWSSFVFKPKTLKFILKVIGFLLVFFLIFKTGGCIASHMNKKSFPSHNHSAVFMKEKEVAIPQEISHHESVQAQSGNDKVELAVRASKDIWIRVKADDRVVFETVLSKGSMESWSANNRIELSGRDLELLNMEVNNKQIGFLGGGERRIRRVLITQEGLTVKK